MNREVSLFKFFDMPVSAYPSVIPSSLILVIVLGATAIGLVGLNLADAVVAAIIGVILHWFGVLVHNYGHFFVAKRIGYPSTGLVLRLVFARVKYPADEGELTTEIHLKRALSGPLVSLILALLVMPFAIFWLIPMGGMAQFLGYWLLVDYGWVFTFGALFPPLRFDWFTNDGGTLLIIMERSRKRSRRAL